MSLPFRLIMSAIIGPIAPYSNVPIEPGFFQPSQFTISAISLGSTTTVTTATNTNYVIGQLVRLLIPPLFGSRQLNNAQGYVIGLSAPNQVQITIDSSKNVNPFIASPYTVNIIGITNGSPTTVQASGTVPFFEGQVVKIAGVGGMTQLNGNTYQIQNVFGAFFNLLVDSTFYGIYTSGGTATLPCPQYVPQIVAIGDINQGIQSSTGRSISSTNIPGSFINISPL